MSNSNSLMPSPSNWPSSSSESIHSNHSQHILNRRPFHLNKVKDKNSSRDDSFDGRVDQPESFLPPLTPSRFEERVRSRTPRPPGSILRSKPTVSDSDDDSIRVGVRLARGGAGRSSMNGNVAPGSSVRFGKRLYDDGQESSMSLISINSSSANLSSHSNSSILQRKVAIGRQNHMAAVKRRVSNDASKNLPFKPNRSNSSSALDSDSTDPFVAVPSSEEEDQQEPFGLDSQEVEQEQEDSVQVPDLPVFDPTWIASSASQDSESESIPRSVSPLPILITACTAQEEEEEDPEPTPHPGRIARRKQRPSLSEATDRALGRSNVVTRQEKEPEETYDLPSLESVSNLMDQSTSFKGIRITGTESERLDQSISLSIGTLQREALGFMVGWEKEEVKRRVSGGSVARTEVAADEEQEKETQQQDPAEREESPAAETSTLEAARNAPLPPSPAASSFDDSTVGSSLRSPTVRMQPRSLSSPLRRTSASPKPVKESIDPTTAVQDASIASRLPASIELQTAPILAPSSPNPFVSASPSSSSAAPSPQPGMWAKARHSTPISPYGTSPSASRLHRQSDLRRAVARKSLLSNAETSQTFDSVGSSARSVYTDAADETANLSAVIETARELDEVHSERTAHLLERLQQGDSEILELRHTLQKVSSSELDAIKEFDRMKQRAEHAELALLREKEEAFAAARLQDQQHAEVATLIERLKMEVEQQQHDLEARVEAQQESRRQLEEYAESLEESLLQEQGARASDARDFDVRLQAIRQEEQARFGQALQSQEKEAQTRFDQVLETEKEEARLLAIQACQRDFTVRSAAISNAMAELQYERDAAKQSVSQLEAILSELRDKLAITEEELVKVRDAQEAGAMPSENELNRAEVKVSGVPPPSDVIADKDAQIRKLNRQLADRGLELVKLQKRKDQLDQENFFYGVALSAKQNELNLLKRNGGTRYIIPKTGAPDTIRRLGLDTSPIPHKTPSPVLAEVGELQKGPTAAQRRRRSQTDF